MKANELLNSLKWQAKNFLKNWLYRNKNILQNLEFPSSQHTQFSHPDFELLHGGFQSRFLQTDNKATPWMENVEGVHRLQLDLHAQLLQHP